MVPLPFHLYLWTIEAKHSRVGVNHEFEGVLDNKQEPWPDLFKAILLRKQIPSSRWMLPLLTPGSLPNGCDRVNHRGLVSSSDSLQPSSIQARPRAMWTWLRTGERSVRRAEVKTMQPVEKLWAADKEIQHPGSGTRWQTWIVCRRYFPHFQFVPSMNWQKL